MWLLPFVFRLILFCLLAYGVYKLGSFFWGTTVHAQEDKEEEQTKSNTQDE
jgi:hypothetical protein